MTAAGDARPAVVVVGASQGIGRAIAKVAARDGGAIVLVARSPEALADVGTEVNEAGGEAFVLELDLLAGGASLRLQEFLAENGLFCDVLVNSAGLGLRGAATVLPHDAQMNIVDLNIRALSDLTLCFLPGMVSRGRGGVINLGSVAGFTPGPNMALYYASKSFVHSFSAALHQELRRTGVTVSCIAPGPVSTEFLQKSGASRAVLFRILPRLGPAYVAERAWRGFKSGRRLVVPGLSAKFAIALSTLLPTALLLPLVERLQRRRGDPCPCGSGKPYTECCAKRGGVRSSAVDRTP